MLSGASGGGKSSVHSLLLRYYDPVKGKITFDGQGKVVRLSCSLDTTYKRHVDIREFSATSWRHIIGVVPQVSCAVLMSTFYLYLYS